VCVLRLCINRGNVHPAGCCTGVHPPGTWNQASIGPSSRMQRKGSGGSIAAMAMFCAGERCGEIGGWGEGRKNGGRSPYRWLCAGSGGRSPMTHEHQITIWIRCLNIESASCDLACIQQLLSAPMIVTWQPRYQCTTTTSSLLAHPTSECDLSNDRDSWSSATCLK